MKRTTLPGARDDRLFFAQVREDPTVELEALQLGGDDRVVVISSGGCTALSMLAAGAGQVVAVDLNKTQNHMVELKAAALVALEHDDVVRFLGGWSASPSWRWDRYQALRAALSSEAQLYWDKHPKAIRQGVLGSGASEKFLSVIAAVVKHGVHTLAQVRRLLAAPSLDEQRAFYDQTWNNRRWRALFRVLINRATFRKTLHPAFFEHVENPSFSRHFLQLSEHVLTKVPIADNYFFHQMLTGFYPEGRPQGLPPYLQSEHLPHLKRALEEGRMELVDTTFEGYLATQPDASVDAFSVSNITEWMDAAAIDHLLSEIHRTATPGARLLLRNFVGWTEIPTHWQDRVVEDVARGEELIAGDRSGMQKRAAVCRIVK